MKAILLDRYYFVLMSLAAAFVLWANLHETTMAGILPYYRDFARVILQGFDPAAATERGLPTFPMWGYGWLMLITESKSVLLILQNTLAILTVWFTTRFLERRPGPSQFELDLFKGLVLLCLPWYAFNSTLWPYSIAANSFAVSALLFVEGCERSELSLSQIICSGLLFGLALNFRSDLIMLPFVIAAGVIIFSRGLKVRTATKGVIWILCIFGMLTPWALYTKHVTGEYLWRSTNSGHVLFIGLGQLPDNKWGITPTDEDPLMRRIIVQRAGPNGSSLDHKGDRILREEFISRVLSDPWEWLRRSGYGARLVLTMGFYPGGFFDQYSTGVRKTAKEFVASPADFVNNYGWSTWRFVLVAVSWVQGSLLLWTSLLLLPLTLFRTIKTRDMLGLIVVLSIGYQTAIGVFAFNLPGYSSNMLLFHLINISKGSSLLLTHVRSA